MGRLGGASQHQCWGRDLLNLPAGDPGFAVIKPSGSEQTVAIVKGDRILVEPRDMDTRLYRYQLGREFGAQLIPDTDANAADVSQLRAKLDSFIQTATKSLLDNTAGAVESKQE